MLNLTPLDVASDLRRETVLALEQMGIHVEYTHHEVGPSQHEIDMRYAPALKMADDCMTYRITVKEYAMKYGWHATFMPKPLEGENGSGMHTHLGLWRGDPGGNGYTVCSLDAGTRAPDRFLVPIDDVQHPRLLRR